MPGPTTPRWRAARAGTFALIVALLAMMGHIVGGGGTPDLSAILVPAVAMGFVLTSVGHRSRPFGHIFAGLAAGQLAFHLLFSVTAHTGMGHEQLDLTRMIGFHLVAAAGSALVVSRGEAALFRLFEAVRTAAARAPAAAAVDLRVPWTALLLAAPASGPGGWLPGTAPRRGPPNR